MQILVETVSDRVGPQQNLHELEALPKLDAEVLDHLSLVSAQGPEKSRSNSTSSHLNLSCNDGSKVLHSKLDIARVAQSVSKTKLNLDETRKPISNNSGNVSHPSQQKAIGSTQSTVSKTQQGKFSPRPSAREIVKMAKTWPKSSPKQRAEQSPTIPGKPPQSHKNSLPSRPQTPTKNSPPLQKQPTVDRPQTPRKGATSPKRQVTPQRLPTALKRRPYSPVPKQRTRNQHVVPLETDSVANLFCDLCNRTLDPAAADVAYLECALHCFHDPCLAKWLQDHNQCPTCGEVTQARR